jgi:hypothetical protein
MNRLNLKYLMYLKFEMLLMFLQNHLNLMNLMFLKYH